MNVIYGRGREGKEKVIERNTQSEIMQWREGGRKRKN